MNMTNDRLKAIKESIVVVVAGNEQSNWHIIKRLNEKGVKFMATPMKYCDYSFYIPGSKSLGIDETIFFWDKVAIERKQHLTEICGNLGDRRNQFDTEFSKAKNDGCKPVLIIEDEKGREKIKLRKELDVGLMKLRHEIKAYENKIKKEADPFLRELFEDEKLLIEQKLNIDTDFAFRKTWRSKLYATSMIASLKAFKERYSLEVIFCKKTETADKMLEIFYKAIDDYFEGKGRNDNADIG